MLSLFDKPRSASRLLRAIALIGAICGASGVLGARASAAEIYALVIGIDDYEHITPLRGAVNDAVDIASAVGGLEPKELVVLINQMATREAILGTWQRFAKDAAAGDTIVVTFAGHGSFEDALYPGDELDGKDETFLLAGFAASGSAASQRIRDNEIAELIATRPDVHHIILADSCHSGTATRDAGNGLVYRFHDLDGIENDPLPPPPPAAQLVAANSTFFAAVSETEKSPEIPIDGKMRGALSFAFAQGIRGRADVDQNGTVTKGELETHIRRFVRSAVNGRQKPQVDPAGAPERSLFQLPRAVGSGTKPGGFAEEFRKLQAMPVSYVGEPPNDFLFSALRAVTENMDDTQRGIVVDFDAGEIRDMNTDILRHLTQEIQNDFRAQIQLTVDRMRMVYALQDAALDDQIDVFFPFGDELYFEDDILRALISGRRSEHVTVLNLAPDGTVQWLYPRYPPLDQSEDFRDPTTLPVQKELSFEAYVTPPFGAEYILVIQTPAPHDKLRRTAARFDGSLHLNAFWDDAVRALEGVPYEVAIHAFYTDETPQAEQ